MKTFILFLLLSVLVYPQATVRTTINYTEEPVIYNSVLDTVEYSNAFSLKGKEGITSVGFDIDTTGAATIGANAMDSCLTVGYQLYFPSIGWCADYTNRTTSHGVTFTPLDTISRSLMAGQNLSMNITNVATEWGVADSARLVFIPPLADAITDTANMTVELRHE